MVPKRTAALRGAYASSIRFKFPAGDCLDNKSNFEGTDDDWGRMEKCRLMFDV